MNDTITLNYDAYDEALKLALAGKQPGETCVLTIRAKVMSNDDESAGLEVEEVTLDEDSYSEPEMEEEMDEDEAPAMVVAVAREKK